MSLMVMLTKPAFYNYEQLEEKEQIVSESAKTLLPSERAFKVFMASSVLLRQYGSGKIIFLYGTSNAGKTSICQEVIAINPNIVVDGIDAAMDRHYFKIISNVVSFKNHFFNRYSTISKCVADKDIPTFLKGQKVKFKPLSTLEDNQAAKTAATYVSMIEELFFSAFHRDAAQDNLFKRVLYLSANGKNVLVDAVECRGFLGYKISKSFHCPLLITLVHCSFAKLAKHKEERNKLALATGQEQNTRFGTYPFLQFPDFLKPQENMQEPFMHSVDRATVTKIYNRHLQEELQFRPIPGIVEEEIQGRRAFELGVLFSRLGLEDNLHKKVLLTPREYFDMEIDTEAHTPTQGALKVLQFIQ